MSGISEDPELERDVEVFRRRYEQGADYSGEEALQLFQQLVLRLPEDDARAVFERAAAEAFGRLSPEQRIRLARLIQRQYEPARDADPEQFADRWELARLATAVQRERSGGLALLFVDSAEPGDLSRQLNEPIAKATFGGIAAAVARQAPSR
jgi:thioesterase domain-containing protein